MKICIPTKTDSGHDAALSAHFGSAPFFTIYDTESKALESVKNQNQHHEHGRCSPRRAVANMGADAVVAAGLGQRALVGLNESGIKVYKTKAKLVSDITNQVDGHLKDEMTLDSACVHGHSDGKHHHHG